jgi:hypothetical protein
MRECQTAESSASDDNRSVDLSVLMAPNAVPRDHINDQPTNFYNAYVVETEAQTPTKSGSRTSSDWVAPYPRDGRERLSRKLGRCCTVIRDHWHAAKLRQPPVT